LLAGEGEALTRKAVEWALAGDPGATVGVIASEAKQSGAAETVDPAHPVIASEARQSRANYAPPVEIASSLRSSQ
jgi:hypothetical protein